MTHPMQTEFVGVIQRADQQAEADCGPHGHLPVPLVVVPDTMRSMVAVLLALPALEP